ncbi:transcriptional regulator [Aureimonas endophytica]|uniref:Transcriptional regulator n=1 Tax=Aureimonas endophytica TaxID=2027858 RepID=A0A916ZMH1_9HYPH|nr:LysR substrate-binding domain-containing protein [Aureimonas endophytica]GGE04947.1 transcriptional regulator [Aureimonas endophytica]
MAPTLAQLRAVDALARTGQFSRAAREIGVSQPTVSAQVQAFESASPFRIFHRDGHSIRVAPEAESLVAKIRIALACLDEIERDMRGEGGAAARRLSLGFSAHRLIMPILSAFVRRHGEIRVVTRGGPSAELIEAVLKGDLDLAAISRPAPDPRLVCFELARCRIVVYGQKGHAALASGAIRIADLDGQKMVLWNRLSGTRSLLDRLAEAAGIVLDPVMEVATLDVAYAAAAVGIGLAIAVEGEVEADEHIDVAVLEDAGSDIGHYLVTLPEYVRHAAVAAFLALAAEGVVGPAPARF